MKLQCSLIPTRCSLLSSFPSVQSVALVGGEGLLKCQGQGFTTPLLSAYHADPVLVNSGIPLFCSVHALLWLNLRLCPSNLTRLHLETQTGSAQPLRAPHRGHASSLSFPHVVKALEGIILSLHFYSYFLW